MSFARELKEELTQIEMDRPLELAEMDAMIRINTAFVFNKDHPHLEFVSMNPRIARRFYKNVKDLYNANMQIFIKKQSNLKKQNMYVVWILDHIKEIMDIHRMLESLNFEEHTLANTPEKKAAYLRGAFLSGGSLNNPTKSYHLEIACQNESEIFFLQHIMNEFNLNAKIAKRRNLLIVYMKDADNISDFMKIIGSYKTFMEFEDIRIRRDYNTTINRMINCEVANEMKTIDAANEQLKQIKYIEKYIPSEKIPEKIYYAMNLRKKNPQANLTTLCEIALKEDNIQLTKSGLNHRFRKIREMEEELREQHKK